MSLPRVMPDKRGTPGRPWPNSVAVAASARRVMRQASSVIRHAPSPEAEGSSQFATGFDTPSPPGVSTP